jgi:DNA (cytosine-5)-methyltransferase 1
MVYYSYGEKVCPKEGKLLDHQPLRLNKDDFAHVHQIPMEKKRANFCNLRGVGEVAYLSKCVT